MTVITCSIKFLFFNRKEMSIYKFQELVVFPYDSKIGITLIVSPLLYFIILLPLSNPFLAPLIYSMLVSASAVFDFVYIILLKL